jgi:deoxyribodipyrimidine photolyase-related protein
MSETMRTVRLVLGDQLSWDISSLADIDRDHDVVLMAEVQAETTYVPHHPKKIAFILSAMRHFAAALQAEGMRVDYVTLDDPANSGSFAGELARAVERHGTSRVVMTEPGEYRVDADLRAWAEKAGIPLEVRPDTRFLCSREAFADWAEGRKQLRMEFFYREMRKRTGVLMEGKDPVGGQWNFDKDNRKKLPDDLKIPKLRTFEPDEITREVLDLVERHFADHFGDLDGFAYAVTAADAEAAFEAFVVERLPQFGDYQDAMKVGQPTLFHAIISPYLNVGLLDPQRVITRVEQAWRDGDAPLNAVEGFIRQILGWREYVRGIYWLKMPDYAETNTFDADRPLPAFYWSGETDMRCLAEAIGQTKRDAYAHHIQRLMVTGLFALLIGADPKEVNAWYLAVYADAFEWVELPNTHGMVLYADGGFLGSKPYAASGKYIDRMSDYCANCRYDVSRQTGVGADGRKACPFNALYWHFLMRHQDRLRGNPRMGLIYKSLDRFEDDKRSALWDEAEGFLDRLS